MNPKYARFIRPILALGLALGVSACASVDRVDSNVYYEAASRAAPVAPSLTAPAAPAVTPFTKPDIKIVAVKTFEDMVLHRGYWPSPEYRQCTSDLKRGPIEKAIRHYLVGCDCIESGTTTTCKKRHPKATPSHGGLVVNCVGLRAEEPSAPENATILPYSKSHSKAGRE